MYDAKSLFSTVFVLAILSFPALAEEVHSFDDMPTGRMNGLQWRGEVARLKQEKDRRREAPRVSPQIQSLNGCWRATCVKLGDRLSQRQYMHYENGRYVQRYNFYSSPDCSGNEPTAPPDDGFRKLEEQHNTVYSAWLAHTPVAGQPPTPQGYTAIDEESCVLYVSPLRIATETSRRLIRLVNGPGGRVLQYQNLHRPQVESPYERPSWQPSLEYTETSPYDHTCRDMRAMLRR